jgi:hypothetical protein
MSAGRSYWTLIARALAVSGTAVMTFVSTAAAQGPGCTPAERRDALRAMQAQVLAVAPRRLDSLEKAIQPGELLGNWILSHGHVVFAHSGAVPVGNARAIDPWPQLLQYAPSPASSPTAWLDFNGPDGPYRLNGWAYLVRYERGSSPPKRRCIADGEWYIHDAGWHLMNGSMLATPDATAEPSRPKLDVGIVVWHPQYWDLHVWMGEDGTPTVSFANPKATGAGLRLPDEVNYRLVNGRRQPVSDPKQ